ncbi:MAG: LysM peptidoglycan-binding domain-containing protein, partial [Tumebacillaceae bacterium]
MSEADNRPSIRIHLDQQVTIEAVQGQEEVEDALVATEITGFTVEDDLYVLRGALSFSGFLRQEDPNARLDQLPDALDDGDIFATDDSIAEAPVLPFHHRLPFLLQVPVQAQLNHQRENGILNVNPKIGQWNVHVLGEETVHLRAELIIQGLSAQEGYVFRCGSQEEGVAASKLDTLLDAEEARHQFAPPQAQEEAEFEAPFEPAQWSIEEGAHLAEHRSSAEEVSEDDWVIESPAQETATPEAFAPFAEGFPGMPFQTGFSVEPQQFREEEASEEDDVVFTPDPRLVFPMPDPNSDWAKQLEAVDRAFGEALSNQQLPFAEQPSFEQLYEQAQSIVNSLGNSLQNELGQGYRPGTGYDQPVAHFEHVEQFVGDVSDAQSAPHIEMEERFEPHFAGEQVPDDEAFVLEESADERSEVLETVDVVQEFETPQLSEANTHEHGAHVFHDAEQEEAERPIIAEYDFEDEVTDQGYTPSPVADVVQNIAPKAAVGPKLSVGGKAPELVESAPIKLSALLSESRTRVPESGSLPAAAQLIRESQSYSESHSYSGESAYYGDSASVQTSQAGHNSDSIWGDILIGQESKVTMKFRIVQEEDSLPDLAEIYQTSVNDLVRANNLQRQEVDRGQI